MYFFLLTSYSNYVTFDDKHLHYWTDFKRELQKQKKSSILEAAFRYS